MKKYLSILWISSKNHIVYIYDILWSNLVLIIRLMILIYLYRWIYGNYWEVDWNVLWFTFEQVCWAVIFAQISVVSRPRIVDEIEDDIKTWKIWLYLINPISYIWFRFIELYSKNVFNLIVVSVIGFWLWFMYLWFDQLTLYWILWGILLLVWWTLIEFWGYLSVWLLAFYTEDIEAFRFIYSKANMMFWGNLLPIPFMPLWMQNIAFFWPFASAWYTAGLIFADFTLDNFLFFLWIQLLWIVIYVVIANIIFAMAEKRLTINWW